MVAFCIDFASVSEYTPREACSSKVSELNQQIASASQEQSSGITQISRALNDLDQSTQRNAASAEEVAASSEQMSQQATNLQVEVRNLLRLIDGQGSDHGSGQVHRQPLAVTPVLPAKVGKVIRLVKNKAKDNRARIVNPEDVIPLGDEPKSNVKTTAGF